MHQQRFVGYIYYLLLTQLPVLMGAYPMPMEDR